MRHSAVPPLLNDIPKTNDVILLNFVEDTAILCTKKFSYTVINILQTYLNPYKNWFHKYRIIVNSSKSTITNKEFIPNNNFILNEEPIS